MAKPSIQLYNSAVDAVQAGDLPLALKSVKNSLTEAPEDAQTWQLYAVILNAMGESEKAEKALEKVKGFGLSEIDELLMKAADAAGQGKMGVAITHYEDALEIDQTRPEIYTSYALALMEEKYGDDAIGAATKAVELAADDPFAQYTKGRVLRLNGRKEEALEALTAATELDGNLVLAAYERGMILTELERYDEGLQCFEQVLKNHPEDENAAEAKAFILSKIAESQ